jgi:hypothetical protein
MIVCLSTDLFSNTIYCSDIFCFCQEKTNRFKIEGLVRKNDCYTLQKRWPLCSRQRSIHLLYRVIGVFPIDTLDSLPI